MAAMPSGSSADIGQTDCAIVMALIVIFLA
jgi:hypothetical protein